MADETNGMTGARGRGAGLLVLAFIVGGIAGAAVDRVAVNRGGVAVTAGAKQEPTLPRREEPNRSEMEEIPTPLRRMNLTPQQEEQLHAIARQWRPKAATALAGVRSQVSELENGMFADMNPRIGVCPMPPA